MRDKEIIRGLECCVNTAEPCRNCRYYCIGNCYNKVRKDAIDLINRQQTEIKNARAEAIKEFAEVFDDELAKLRDTYFERGLKDYSLVCEVIHDYLYRTLRGMVGE